MAESSNVERNPYLTNGGQGIVMEESEIEVILPDEESGLDMIMDMVEEMTYNHNENLVDKLDGSELDDIASKVIEGFEADKESRGEWESTFEKGFDLLGLKLRETSEPFEGACTAVHPLLIESAVKFQSKATQELFPAKGPVKTQILGNPTIEKDRQANRVMNFMNYQLTDQMPEYFSELERMLFNLPVFGSAFKKTYFDMALERPMSEFVPIDQFYVSNFASDLQNAERYTHMVYRSPNDLKREIEAGMYSLEHYDDGLPEATPVEPTPIKSKMDMILGISPNYDDEPQYTILEQHCYLEIEEEIDDDENAMTVALPYIVSVDEHSRKVLCIRRNWSEDDPRKEKLLWFTHYRFVPGFGFYGLGFIHFLGNLTATATAAVRNLVDAGQFATLPGGFKARGVRIVGSNDAIAPGEFKEVEATGIDLTKSIIPLPYKEPSQTLMQMLQFVTAAGQKFADATEQVISDSTNYGPVGTTLALLEASTKFFSAIHKRLHYSQRQELRILARINHDFLPDEYPYDIANIEGQIFRSDFDGRIDVIPVSDPNVPSASHRLAMAQTVMQMAQQAPQGMYNLREINRVMLDAAGIENPDQFLIPEQKAEPRDPISDINAASQGLPIKAFPGQDHQAHITVKQSFIADPTLGQNPVMQALVPILQANIREHMIMQYEEQMSGMLTQGVEQAGVKTDEAISKITQGAAQEILQNNQRMAEQGSVEDLERMTLELQRQQLELEKEKVKIDAAQKAADIALQEEKLDLEKDKVEVEAAEKLAKIKGVARDREIVANSKKADRDDKFLIEVMKMLFKETGATVEKLKEEVTLRPEGFYKGGTVNFSDGGSIDNLLTLIGGYADKVARPIGEVIGWLFGAEPLGEQSELDLNLKPASLAMVPQPVTSSPQRPQELGRASPIEEVEIEELGPATHIPAMKGYQAPIKGEIEVEELPPVDVKSTMDALIEFNKDRQRKLDTAPLIKEDVTVDDVATLQENIVESKPKASIVDRLYPRKDIVREDEIIGVEPESPSPPKKVKVPSKKPIDASRIPDITREEELIGDASGIPDITREEELIGEVPDYMDILRRLEGPEKHRDERGILTAGWGVVIDPKQTKAYNRSKRVAEELGFDITNLKKNQYRPLAEAVVKDVDKDLQTELGEKYKNLSPLSKALVVDAKYHTGETYKKLTRALPKYEKNKSRENLKKVIADSRRTVKNDKGKKVPTAGLDNRVVKLLFGLGYLPKTFESFKFINESFNTPGLARWSQVQ